MLLAKRVAVFLLVCLMTWGLLSPVRSAMLAQQAPPKKGAVTPLAVAPETPNPSMTVSETDPSSVLPGSTVADAVAATNSASAVGTNGTLNVNAQITVTENVGGYTYVWLVQLTDPNGNNLGTQYYDNAAVVPAAGQTVNISLSVSYPDPGVGTQVVARLLRYAPSDATIARSGSASADAFSASSLNLTTPFQYP